MKDTKRVVIYTDGAVSGNPGPGGWAAILQNRGRRQELSGGFRHTTNNRMELFAVIAALESLAGPEKLVVYSDSRYLVESVNQNRLELWRARGWKHTQNKPVPNADLWQRLMGLLKVHEVQFMWVEGHSGIIGNERVDRLAQQALSYPGLPPDEGYESVELKVQEELLDKEPIGHKLTGRKSEVKITKAGQACRKCNTPVTRRVPARQLKQGQKYYYLYYYACPKCETVYFVDEARVYLDGSRQGENSGTRTW